MRMASSLLALAVVLGFANDVGAASYLLRLGGQEFGIREIHYTIGADVRTTWIYLGPLGEHKVPFTPTQGLIGFCGILVMLILLPSVLTFRWRRKRVAE